MQIKDLNSRPKLDQNGKAAKLFKQMNQLLAELKERDISDEVINIINNEIDSINTISTDEKEIRKQLKNSQSHLLKTLEKSHKIVTKNHNRNAWIAIGMAAFGIPLGVALGSSLGNMALLGAGLPIGMGIGIGVGTSMDQKAKDEGRQLNVDIKY